MNKKVLKTMLILCVAFLCALYVLKMFMPEQFVISIENEVLIKIGNYIDTHAWADYLFGILTSFITYWLYLCAVCKRWYLNVGQSIIVLVTIGLSIGCTFWDINIYTAFSCVSFVLLPYLFKAKLKEVAIIYTIHMFAQALSLSIRNIPLYITSANTLILTIMTLDCYLWLLSFYLYHNYKEKEKLWDGNVRHCTEKMQSELKEKSQKSTEKLKPCSKIKSFIKSNFNKQTVKTRLHYIWLTIKDFIVDELWIYVIVIGSIALCSWIFNRWVQGIMMCVAHIAIRRVFDKQYHCNTTAGCLSLTLAIVWFAIPLTLPITASLLSSIPIAFLICFVGFVAQDRVDLHKEVKRLNAHADELLAKLNHKDVWSMTEDELYVHCRNHGLDSMDCEIAKIIVIDRLKGKELYNAIGYSERQTKRKRKSILERIE